LEDRWITPVLIGCTATGKTGLLLELRRRYDFQVINADSRQIYRGMDIGTAKPDEDQRRMLVHHLLDIVDLDESFSAGDFARLAGGLIEDIRRNGAVPLVSGGTALYVMALTGALDPLPRRCSGLREGFEELEEEVPGILMKLLREADPDSAGSIGDRDVRRQVRALEIFVLTGSRPSVLRRGGDPERRASFRIVGITIPREEHRRRIRNRARGMIDYGLIDEVKTLLDNGWTAESALGNTIGYREVLDYLDGEIASVDDLVEEISSNTWQLARRQRNMFGRIRDVEWVDDDADLIGSLLFDEGGE
jgi:tRNA dimethylallyltransferase